MEILLKKYAKLAVRTGVNVQKGQTLIIQGKPEHIDFIRMCTQEAYEAGAKKVVVKYNDDYISKYHYEYQSIETLTHIPQWYLDELDDYMSQDMCRLNIYAPSPGLFKDVDGQKIAATQQALGKALKPWQEYSMANKGQWSLVSLPTKEWAQMVFKDLDEEEAKRKLLEAILEAVRINHEDDPVDLWDAHNQKLSYQNKMLNDYNFKSIHFKNSLGTDIVVNLVKGHRWAGGSETSVKGVSFNPNMPTEESFSMPDRLQVNGIVYATKPLNYHGKLIDEFWLKFEDGMVVDYDAKKEKEALKSLLETDEGSKRLGEIALISHDSPISQSNLLFYNTLFDENASCHMALGASYPMNLKGGLEMDEETLLLNHANQSIIHEDFMFGSADLNAVGLTFDNQEIQIIKDGNIIL